MSLRIESPDALLIAAYRAMTPSERLQAGLAATEMVRQRLRAHYAEAHPEWDVSEVEWAVAERLLRAGG